MSIKLVMPKAGLTNTEGTVGEWKVKEGSTVQKGDVILEIENEKVTLDFESPGDGILHITAERGTEVEVGGLMGFLAESQEEYDSISSEKAVEEVTSDTAEKEKNVKANEKKSVPAASSTSEKGKRIRISPLARKKAAQEGIDISLIDGTGPSGRIVAKDIDNFVKSSKKVDYNAAQAEEPIRIPNSPIRKAIAKRMLESTQTMAQVTDSVELDATKLVELRERLVAQQDVLGTKITMNDILCMAAIKMAKEHPLANATFTEKEIITYPSVNLSVAVASDNGLTSPVIKGADKLSLVELSKALKDIVTRARDNQLTSDDFEGGTFTVTNMGIYPVDHFTPIINPPQSTILGFGRIVEKPVVKNGEIVAGKTMSISLSFDHRVFDGSEAGNISITMKKYIENPELILL